MAPIDQKDKLNNIDRLLCRQQLGKVRPDQSANRTAGKNKSPTAIQDKYVQSSRGVEISALRACQSVAGSICGRFERLRQQIASGGYQVSSGILAENILAASVDENQEG